MSLKRTFQHEAMKTTFSLHFTEASAELAENVARAAIELIDTIENTLSRYIEGNDVWQINHMAAGETLFLTEHCYNCLRSALEAHLETEGRFDATLGRQIEHRKQGVAGTAPSLMGQLMLNPERPAIHCIEAGREVDFGGIAKGYALDQIKRLAQDWGVAAALFSAGASTQLAYGDTSWPVTLRGEEGGLAINLKNQALSVSGIGLQGSHIVAANQQSLNYAYPRVWLCTPTAAKADAYSTAALLMQNADLLQFSKRLDALYVESTQGIEAV